MAFRFDRKEQDDDTLTDRDIYHYLSTEDPFLLKNQKPTATLHFEEMDLIVFNQELLKKYEGELCNICYGEYQLNDEAKKLDCKHFFHTECIFEWLKKK